MNDEPVEKIILDFRNYLDKCITFLELYEQNLNINQNEKEKFKKSCRKFNDLISDLKNLLLNENIRFSDLNSRFEFSKDFLKKKSVFFKIIFQRLDTLDQKLSKNKELKIFFKAIQKLCKKANEFIGYLESPRWHRMIAIEILNKHCEINEFILDFFEKTIQNLANSSENLNLNQNHHSKKNRRNYLSDLKESSSKLSQYLFFGKNPNICPCLGLLLILIIFLVFFLFILPIVKYFTSSRNSNIYALNLQSQREFLELFQMNQKDKLSIFSNLIDLPWIFSAKQNKPDVKYFWHQVFDYMKEVYVVFLSLVTFLSIEFFIK